MENPFRAQTQYVYIYNIYITWFPSFQAQLLLTNGLYSFHFKMWTVLRLFYIVCGHLWFSKALSDPDEDL